MYTLHQSLFLRYKFHAVGSSLSLSLSLSLSFSLSLSLISSIVRVSLFHSTNISITKIAHIISYIVPLNLQLFVIQNTVQNGHSRKSGWCVVGCCMCRMCVCVCVCRARIIYVVLFPYTRAPHHAFIKYVL